MPLKLFYVDYPQQQVLESKDAREAPKEEILHRMDCVLRSPRNFVGVIDEDNTTLQFMVNEDNTIDVDIPVPANRGSFVKTTDLQECVEIVGALEDRVDATEMDGLTFRTW